MSPKASTRLLATQSDGRLLALAQAGHERAFEALVGRYRTSLLRYCRRVSPSGGARAEDLVQQTFLAAWSALRQGAEVRELRPWLYRIAHNAAINAARDAARHGAGAVYELDLDAAAPIAAEEHDLAGGLALREALSGMAALPQMQREVIFRTALAGHSHEEVAGALGISDGAVRGLLYRARSTLRGAITAVTPPPLLAWMAGGGMGAGAAGTGEVAAGGGIGLGGLLVKGGAVAFTAGTLITGAVIVHTGAPMHRHRAHGSGGGGSDRSERAAASGGSAGQGIGIVGGSPTGQASRLSASIVRAHVRVGGPGVRVRISPGAHRDAPRGTQGGPTANIPIHAPSPGVSGGSGGSAGGGGGIERWRGLGGGLLRRRLGFGLWWLRRGRRFRRRLRLRRFRFGRWLGLGRRLGLRRLGFGRRLRLERLGFGGSGSGSGGSGSGGGTGSGGSGSGGGIWQRLGVRLRWLLGLWRLRLGRQSPGVGRTSWARAPRRRPSCTK